MRIVAEGEADPGAPFVALIAGVRLRQETLTLVEPPDQLVPRPREIGREDARVPGAQQENRGAEGEGQDQLDDRPDGGEAAVRVGEGNGESDQDGDK